jgi:hypothetical protein
MIMRYPVFLLTGLFFLWPVLSSSQETISWKILADVFFETAYSEETGLTSSIPHFGTGPLAYEGKEVVLSGYFIPVVDDNISLILSQNPFTSCYFCGNAGPESVIEVWLKPDSFRNFSPDEVIRFRGVLELNRSNPDRLPYQLSAAQELD